MKGILKMQNSLLKPLIARIQKQDMTAFPILFEEFKKLICFYATKLRYEDAASELTLFFIELLYEIKLSKFVNDDSEDIHRYISASVRNKYTYLAALRLKDIKCENDLTEGIYGFNEKLETNFWFERGICQLNDMQKTIIIYHFVYGYTIAEIAEILRVSRQAVNKTKNHALTLLKEALINDEDFFL